MVSEREKIDREHYEIHGGKRISARDLWAGVRKRWEKVYKEFDTPRDPKARQNNEN